MFFHGLFINLSLKTIIILRQLIIVKDNFLNFMKKVYSFLKKLICNGFPSELKKKKIKERYNTLHYNTL